MDMKERMLSSLPYKSFGEELFSQRQKVRETVYDYNHSRPCEEKLRDTLLSQILGKRGEHILIEPPFHCDYGYNIFVGENFYSNFNLTILDCARVTIGDDVMFAPNVTVSTAGHPVHSKPRTEGWEYAFPVTIGDRVWLGAGVIINPGVTIGSDTVIGAGSVVTKDIPAGVVAVGNPCKVLRKITEEDKKYYFKNKEFDVEI